MALRIVNPYYKSPVEIKADQHGPAVVAWLQANAGNKIVTMTELRTGLPAIAADLTRTVVNQICADNGLQIENSDDTQA